MFLLLRWIVVAIRKDHSIALSDRWQLWKEANCLSDIRYAELPFRYRSIWLAGLHLRDSCTGQDASHLQRNFAFSGSRVMEFFIEKSPATTFNSIRVGFETGGKSIEEIETYR